MSEAEEEPPVLLAQTVNCVVVNRCVGTPQMVPLLVPKLRPAGRLPLISHEVMVPEPTKVGASGKSPLTVLFMSVKFSGEYESVGTSSLMVMLMVAEDEPPLLFAQTVNVLRFINEVGVPQIVPLLVPKERPLGSAGLMAQEVMTPGPVKVAFSGKSVLSNPFVSVKFSGE